mmetsp:Transcript_21514/g.43188  ORF Transcript_21514/g.43188 Transcript_21514/m.43188 type:complete len:165 (-) Transcript_21514:322-816(-)
MEVCYAVKKVRLIGKDGSMIGVVAIDEALSQARKIDCDLVKVKDGNPSICRIMAHDEVEKKDRISKIQEQMKSLKIIKMRSEIDPHDLKNKLNLAAKKLKKGHPVRFHVQKTDKRDLLFREVINTIHEELIETGIGHTLDSLNELYQQPAVLLSPFPLHEERKI